MVTNLWREPSDDFGLRKVFGCLYSCAILGKCVSSCLIGAPGLRLRRLMLVIAFLAAACLPIVSTAVATRSIIALKSFRTPEAPSPQSTLINPPPPSCPSQLAGCKGNRVVVYASAASSAPPPRNLVAANYNALLGEPTFIGLCMPGPPSFEEDQNVLWSFASGDLGNRNPSQTTLNIEFSSALYATQVCKLRMLLGFKG